VTAHVADALDRYASITRAALEEAVPSDLSEDHLRAPMLEYPRRGGKALRPALCMATCEAFGGRFEDALPSAVALEMLHNAFLVHDDIEDAGTLRRGRPTLHLLYGTDRALNAGDALALVGYGHLRRNRGLLGSALAERIGEEFDEMSRHTVDGQAIELGWRVENRLDLTPDDYLHLVMKKTCWYTTVTPMRVGALIGSRGTAPLAPMVRFGFHLGAAFQIRDDILDLEGDPDEFGKQPLGDLLEGKRTLMLLHLWAAADPPVRHLLATHLGRPARERTAEDAAAIVAAMQAHGSLSFAREFARGVAADALDAFEEAFAGVPDTPARRFVRDLVPYMVERVR
jgi:geranylgeranyl diphosphate synthase type II